MREALAISAEEGLKEQWQRHENMHHMLWDGLKSMGLKSFVQNDDERLITLNTITVRPELCATPLQAFPATMLFHKARVLVLLPKILCHAQYLCMALGACCDI